MIFEFCGRLSSSLLDFHSHLDVIKIGENGFEARSHREYVVIQRFLAASSYQYYADSRAEEMHLLGQWNTSKVDEEVQSSFFFVQGVALSTFCISSLKRVFSLFQ